MPNRMKSLMHEMGGNAGTQGDFLDECWEIASPSHSGTHGNAETQWPEPSCVTERSQSGQERNFAEITGTTALCSRVPDEIDQQQTFEVDWVAAATRLTNQFINLDTRRELFTLFYERAWFVRADRGLERGAAEREAYGWLLTKILNLAMDMQINAKDAIHEK